MNDNEREQAFIKKVNQELDAGLDTLDPSITARLREARRQAVGISEKRPWGAFRFPRLLPLGGVTALAVLTLAVSLWLSTSSRTFPNRATDDLEVLTVQGNLDMYKDLEFYQWLAQSDAVR